MSIPAALLTTTCDIYRPFGSVTVVATGVACRLVPELARGRNLSYGALTWTHHIDLNDSVDILDGCTRTYSSNGLNYSDGDEVHIPSGGVTRYVVVWVEVVNLGSERAFKRAYLMRHDG